MFRTFYKSYSDNNHNSRKDNTMDDRVKIGLAIAGTAVVAYTLGYNKATTKFIKQFGGVLVKEASLYLATQDHLRYRGR